MQKRNWCILICCIGFCITATAQPAKTTTPPETPRLLVRISPLAILEPDMQVMPGVEYRFNKKFSVGLDAGYIFWRWGLRNFDPGVNEPQNGTPVTGYRLRPEFRYYFRNTPRSSWFLAAEASYKRTSTNMSDEVCITIGQAVGCSYFQRVDYKEIKSMPGGAIKVGVQQFFGDNRRLFFEAFLGLGFKHTTKTKEGYVLPPNSRNGIVVEG
ncbi:MAG: DUF3575 domain-containing protein, partial [Dinghuibacter sp.]|nr:DUF3575 domain-containing protein [Dinghuibacter sp.]